MTYTTTRCKNCGYATRSFEGGVPKVQIGAPIIRCPKCGYLILDSINSEYEFMTDKERANFGSSRATVKSYPFNIIAIVMGICFFIAAITASSLTVPFIIAAIICLAVGISNLLSNSKAADQKIIEQKVYESLQRTKNTKYVEFIEKSYSSNKIKRIYRPYSDKESFFEQYKYFELRESYKEEMKEFGELLRYMQLEDDIEEPQGIAKEYSSHTSPPSSPADKKATIMFCRKCGNKLIEGSAFCNKCGSKTNWN